MTLLADGAEAITVTEIAAEGRIASHRRAAVRQTLSWVAHELAVKYEMHVCTVNGLFFDKSERDDRLDPENAKRYLPYGKGSRVYGLKVCSGDTDAIWKASQEFNIYNGCSKAARQMEKIRVALDGGVIKLKSCDVMLSGASAELRDIRVGKRRFALMKNGTEL